MAVRSVGIFSKRSPLTRSATEGVEKVEKKTPSRAEGRLREVGERRASAQAATERRGRVSDERAATMMAAVGLATCSSRS
jgi:hypothetical protein